MDINWPELLIGLVGGALSGWLITYLYDRANRRDSEKHTRMLTTLLVVAETAGQVELARDASGQITGGRNIRLHVEPGILTLKG